MDQDSLLHIDPLLLKGSAIPEFTNAYTEFFNYFRLFIPLVKASKTDDFQDRFFKKIVNRFTFKEIPNTGLGFSKRNTKGRGISGALSIQLAHSAYAIINAGLEDPEIFGLMQLIEDNMAADRISDMTIAILQKHFLEYTQRISKEMGLKTYPYKFEYGVVYQVPFYNGKPIHFIPESFLADLPVAHEFDDIDSVCNYNKRLKRKIGELIGITWSDYKDYKKEDWRNLILGNKMRERCRRIGLRCHCGRQVRRPTAQSGRRSLAQGLLCPLCACWVRAIWRSRTQNAWFGVRKGKRRMPYTECQVWCTGWDFWIVAVHKRASLRIEMPRIAKVILENGRF